MAIGLLQKILFHEDGVQSLGNYALDLFDHVIFAITHLAVGYSFLRVIGIFTFIKKIQISETYMILNLVRI